MTATLKKRAPLWVWALLLTVVIIIVIIAVLQFTGYVDFSFIGVAYLATFLWAGSTAVNAVLLTIGFVALGAVADWFLSKYVFGIKFTPQTVMQQAYQPQNGLTAATPIITQTNTPSVIVEDTSKKASN